MKAHNNLTCKGGLKRWRSLTERQILRFAKQTAEDTMTQREAIYARYEKCEEELAHCYFVLHERFIADPLLARFWAEAAMDEMQHFSMLRFCREHGVMTDDAPDLKTTGNIEDLLETVKSLVADLEISVEEAFYASLLMESSELEEIYKRLTGGLERDHPLLYQAIHASLQSHYGEFREAAERFCKDRGFIEAFRNLGGTAS
jgi:hypothetical protein